jgi:Rps23 Pro-64 3,4-dihydroxylase Tpa1-like proline 4-hydroxylase
MHSELYQFFDNLKTSEKEIQKCSKPAPIWILDDFLPQAIFDIAVKQIKNITCWTEFSNEYSNSYRKECRSFTESPLLESLTGALNNNKTISWLEELTGITGLIPDPYLLGGGLCSLSTNNKLDLHTDFPWNDRLRLNRKVNLMLYLNEHWDNSWGGKLEFWDEAKTQCIQRVDPLPNRLILWAYDPNLIHGVPEALSCPADISRNNLILFYYTSNATWEVEPRRSNFSV